MDELILVLMLADIVLLAVLCYRIIVRQEEIESLLDGCDSEDNDDDIDEELAQERFR